MRDTPSNQLFMFAGEPSGDLHGSRLIQALRNIDPKIMIEGVAGPKMREQVIDELFGIEQFSVMGFSDVIRSLPKLWKLFYGVRDAILKRNPSAVVLIDYADFNLRLAKALRKLNYQGKIIHYISPSVWAWRKGRVHEMAKTLDKLLTIYPFEKEHYRSTNLQVEYVGNPLSEYLANHHYVQDWALQLGIPCDIPLIALFPGSRQGEILRNLPLQIRAAEKLLLKEPHRIFAISCSDVSQEGLIVQLIKNSSLQFGKNAFLVPRKYTYELMDTCRSAIAKSGTITLELALHRKPTVVIYNLTLLNRFIAKYVMRVNLPHYCIVNILAKGEVFPELIEHGLTEDNLSKKLLELDQGGPLREKCIINCDNVKEMLKETDASRRSAHEILNLMPNPERQS